MKKVILKIFVFFSFIVLILISGVRIYLNSIDVPIYDFKLAYNFILNKNEISQYENLNQLLGFSENDKLLIIHADDLGLSRSVNELSLKALDSNYVNSASIMMPTPEVKEVAEHFIKNPTLDIGLHLTVTAEWENYKWDGISPKDSIPSMIDEYGNFHEKKKNFIKNAKPEEVRIELQSQIDYAKSLGIIPSHIDSHEGALFFSPEIFKVYLEIAEKNNLPAFVPKELSPHFDKNFSKPKNLVIVEKLYMADKSIEFKNWENYYHSIIKELKPGLNEIIVHLGTDNKELKDITSNRIAFGSEWRNLDYEIISSSKFRSLLKDNDIKLVNWTDIKNIIYPN